MKNFDLPRIGENITFFPMFIDAEQIVEHWYGEHSKYEYETPGWQMGTNYFTQIIWKATEEIGIGRAKIEANLNDRPTDDETNFEQVIVAFYRPAGNNNRNGQFAANIQKPINISDSEK
ncbi:unnamed protein product [Dracunculus medinensis]|uniref:SCP domain-containing protein n=1 Tax=Dracunculus medinensis TaxID=318479 RepID=A0A0N4UM70_DRAME|nr:unnamed protein product [Dracunculus medinensis]